MRALVTLGLVAACVIGACTAHRRQGVPARELGLVKGDLFATPVPPAVHFNDREPGAGRPGKRMHPEAPPPVPHTVRAYDPADLEENACLECHDGEAAKAVPASHVRPGSGLPGSLAPARWLCLTCHVEESDAPPLPLPGR